MSNPFTESMVKHAALECSGGWATASAKAKIGADASL